MIDISTLAQQLLNWNDPSDGEASKSRELCLGLLRGTPRPFSRDQFTPGHMTGTACVLHPSQLAVLVIHHAKLDRWLLPGGHVEWDADGSVAGTARREAEEESGVEVDESFAPWLVGIDVHSIPERKSEPYHLHHDLIFGFRAISEGLRGSEEVRGLAWCGLEEFDRYALPDPIRRAVARAVRL